MCGAIDGYLKLFSTLNVNRNRQQWLVDTCFSAPHKPFLLFSILDLIASGSITKNFIEPSFELAETFSSYWSRVMPLGTSGSMALPFYHLGSAPFWHLVPQPDTPHQTGRNIGSVKRLRELYLGARFDDDLYPLLVMKSSREKLRTALITTFFAPEILPVVAEQAIVNCDSSLYSVNLLTAESPPVYAVSDDKPEELKKRVRDQGFRKAIVKLYAHRCALCGIRMLTPEGHTIVEAAHIVPWSKSQDDKPQNGLALCRLCHWSFDEGLMGVGQEYDVLISPAVRQDKNFPGHMETLSGRIIFRPQSNSYWPDQQNLEIHRKETFRKK